MLGQMYARIKETACNAEQKFRHWYDTTKYFPQVIEGLYRSSQRLTIALNSRINIIMCKCMQEHLKLLIL